MASYKGIFILLLAFSSHLKGEESALNVLFPWQTPGIDGQIIAFAKDDLKKVRRGLSKALFNNPQNLDVFAKKQNLNLTLNAKRRSSKFITGELKEPLSEKVMIQPLFCYIKNQYLIGLSLLSRKGAMLLGAHYKAIDTKEWQKAIKEDRVAKILLETIEDSRQKAFLMAQTSRKKENALKISLDLAHNNPRQTIGSKKCLNQLLLTSLAAKFQVKETQSYHDHLFLKRVLKEPLASKRATSILLLDWHPPKDLTWPRKLKASYRYSETVFGTRVFDELKEEFTLLKKEDRSLEMSLPPSLLARLEKEENHLRLNERPKAIKIDRAWVYLDRGRAWGLKMKDRLIYQNNEATIKGHIVGFFGAKLALEREDGSRVSEGAIMYMRTGREFIKKGLVFDFDPTAFPAAWPPEKTP